MKNYTDITLLIDRSGSMESCKPAMEEALVAFIKTHHKLPSSRLSVVQFDSLNPQEVTVNCLPIRAVERITIDPRGGTPLIDAFCLAIDNTGVRLVAMREVDRPARVLFVVITDGAENASHQFTRANLVERTTRQHNDYKWQFVYLGANQDAFTEAANFGIPLGNAMTFRPQIRNLSPMFVGENSSISGSTFSYASGTTPGVEAFSAIQLLDAVADDSVTFANSTVPTPKPRRKARAKA